MTALAVSAAWVDGTSNPVFAPSGGAYYPSVLYDAAEFSGHGAAYPYKIWFSNGNATAVGVAGSDDGTAWTVLSPAVTGLTSPHHVTVAYDPGGFGGTEYYYRIWYWDQSVSIYEITAIRTARSADGVSWTSDQAITQVGSTVITGVWPDWNRGSYGPIQVLYSASGSATLDDANIFTNKYVMFYDGTTGGQQAWGLAYSTDGLLWKGYNGGVAPVLPVGGTGAWDENFATHGSAVRNPDGTWDLWYSGGVTAAHQGIGHATSPDGLAWTRDPANPIVELGCPATSSPLGCAGSWNAARNYTPVVLAWPSCPTQIYRMWRTGANAAGTKAIGTASMVPSTLTVRNVPVPYGTIQSAVDAANPGDTVLVASGTYDESVSVNRTLTLEGTGLPTIRVPAGGYGVTIAQGTSCVTLRGIRFLGDSSAAVQEGGVLIEARTAPVSAVTVDSCVFYGLDNGFESRGTLSDIKVLSSEFEAIQDWSAIEATTLNMGSGLPYAIDGVQVCGNTIKNSSTIPVKLSNYSFGSGSTMRNLNVAHNQIYGNTVTGNENWRGGITLRHGADTVTLTGNTVRDNVNMSGINIAGAGTYDHLTIRSNALFRNTGTDRNPPNPAELSAGIKFRGITGPSTYDVAFNAFCGNAGHGLDWPGAATLTAEDNWWGCNAGPGGTGCQTATLTVDADPWLTLTLAADPTSLLPLGTSDLTARLTMNSDGADTSGLGTVPDGIPIAFSGTLGTVVPSEVGTFAGEAEAVFTAGSSHGTGSASATLCGQTVTQNIQLLCEVQATFITATASPSTQGASSQQSLILRNSKGSSVPASFAFTWDPAFTVNAFSADPDGLLGAWQEMRPYGAPFVPTASHQIIRLTASTAYVDVNDSGSYDPGTDYDVSEAGRTITVSRAVAGGAIETQDAGYRLVLQESLFVNPASTGSYPVYAGLLGSCPDAWSGSADETITAAGAGCDPGDLHDLDSTIRLSKSGTSFTVSWTEDPSPDPCMAGYTVFGSADCTTWGAFSPVAEVGMTGQATAGQGLNLEFFLVAERGAHGETGPLGHYGR